MSEFNRLYNECPICNGVGKRCAETYSDTIFRGKVSESHFIHCSAKDEVSPPSNYKFIGQADHTTFFMYVETNERGTAQGFKKRQKRATSVKKFLEPKDFNRSYVKLALYGENSLSEEHSLNLARRGIDPEQWYYKFFFTLEEGKKASGVDPRFPGLRDGFLAQNGLAIPCFNDRAEVVGYQVMTNDPDAKYKWAYPNFKAGVKYQCLHKSGALVVQFAEQKDSDILILCEGILKPLVAHSRLKVNMLGCSGGDFKNSLPQIEYYISYLKGKNPNLKVYLAPDAGFIKNKSVRDQYDPLLNSGFLTGVLDWGQFEDKLIGDIDEISKETYQKALILPIEEYENILLERSFEKGLENYKRILFQEEMKEEQAKNPVTPKSFTERPTKPYERGKLTQEDLNIYTYTIKPSDRYFFINEAKRLGARVVLDASAPGTGKSYQLEQLINNSHYPAIWYLSPDHRNPATAYLEATFQELPARHNGIGKDTQKKTLLGNAYRKRVESASPSNCIHSEAFAAARGKNVDVSALGICRMCPLRQDCKQGTGDGFGFLHEMNQALKQGAIRANINGVSPNMIPKNSLLIVDEPSKSINPVKQIKISAESFYYLPQLNLESQKLVNEYSRFLQTVSQLMFDSELTDNWDFNQFKVHLLCELGDVSQLYQAVRKAEEKLLEDLGKKLLKNPKLQLPTLWMGDLLSIINGRSEGNILFEDESFYIIKYSSFLPKAIERSALTLLLDATLSEEEVRALCKYDAAIAMCEVVDTSHQNVEVVQVTGIGQTRNQRSKASQEKIEALKSKVSQKHEKVGVIEYKSFAKDGEAYWFHESRGSNRYQDCDALILVGLPYANISAKFRDVSGLLGKFPDEEEFRRWYDRFTESELIQAIGRLRGNQRSDKQLTVYLVDNGVTMLPKFGFKLSALKYDVFMQGESYVNKSDRTLSNLSKLVIDTVSQNKRVTSKAIAKMAKLSERTVSRLFSKFGGFKEVTSLATAFIKDPNKLGTKFKELLSNMNCELPESVQSLSIEDKSRLFSMVLVGNS